ncbi:MAG: hypothetical protein ABID04_02630, partial [Patescibacteria group bacterium]
DQEPACGQWWTCGTRLIGEESLLEGSQRALKRELGLDIDQERIKTIDKVQFVDWPVSHKAPFGENLLHFIAYVEISKKEINSIKLRNQEHSNKQWISLVEVIKDSKQFLPPLIDICSFFQKNDLL